MPDNLLIRDFRASDLSAVTELTMAAYAEFESLWPPDAWQSYIAVMKQTLAGDDPPRTHIVAERDGVVVGSVLLIPANTPLIAPDDSTVVFPYAEVRMLCVPPAERGKRVARALMDECVRRTRAVGSPALGLHTIDMMEAAVRLYEQMGFMRTPETDFRPTPEIWIKGYRLNFD